MRPYGIIDLHCDTLTRCGHTNTGSLDTLDDSTLTLSLSKLPADVRWAQFCAVFIPDRYTGEAALRYFDTHADNFYRQMSLFSDRVLPCRSWADIENAWAQGRCAAVLTLENGSVLGGKLENVKHLADRGVRCVTIVWNGENEIGSGHSSEKGISPFGREAIPAFEDNGILIDVSHLNDPGFYELLELAKKPFLATHSNARAICSHKRNLTDEMIAEMLKRGCLIGLNFFVDFIDDSCRADSPDKLYRHISHFLDLGAEKNLALGSDFDGSTPPPFLTSPDDVARFYDYLLARKLPQEIADGIFWKNAETFLRTWLV